MQNQTEYIHTKTIEFPGMIARIYSPVLTDEERNRRMKRIHDAAAELLKSQERTKKQ